MPTRNYRTHTGHLLRQLVLGYFGWLALPAFAQQATLSENILHIPYLSADSKFYSAELALTALSDPVTLELIAAIEVPANENLMISTYQQGVLFVPEIMVNGSSYWAELQTFDDSQFQLVDSGSNADAVTNSALGIDTNPQWQRLEGGASDIGIGADGSIWVIGTDRRPGGFGIYYWAATYWQRVDGSGVRIDVGPDGIPWVVNDKHQIHRWVDGFWQQMQGDARDIGIGADGSVWVAAGGGIFRWNGVSWDRTSGSAVRIDVDPQGIPWIIDHTDDIYQLIGGRWIKRPGYARDIGIGADGSVWVIGTSSGSGGHGIFRWTGSFWNQVHGSARQISVDPAGSPWVLGTGGEIYQGL